MSFRPTVYRHIALLIFVIGSSSGLFIYDTDRKIRSAAQEGVSQFVSKLEGVTKGDLSITYDAVEAGIFRDNVTVNNISFNDPYGHSFFKMESASLLSEDSVKNDTLPIASKVSIQGFEIINERALKDFERTTGLVYNEHNVDFDFEYNFSESKDTLSAQGNLLVSDMNDVSAKITLSNVKNYWNAIESNYASNGGHFDMKIDVARKSRRIASNININDFNLIYINKGEVGEKIGKMALKQNISVDDVELKISERINEGYSYFGFSDEANVFLKDPQNFTLSFNPEKPMTFKEISSLFHLALRDGDKDVFKKAGVKINVNSL